MAYIYNFTDTWNNGATTFTGIGLNVTDTASSASSKLMDLQIGGESKLQVSKTGSIAFAAPAAGNSYSLPTIGTPICKIQFFDLSYDPLIRRFEFNINGAGQFAIGINGAIQNSNGYVSYTTGGLSSSPTIRVAYDADGILYQRSGTTAQGYRLYNTYTDASNYERFGITWATNVMTLATEAAGTGTKRDLKFDSANRSAYIASPSATEIRDILISFGLMAAS